MSRRLRNSTRSDEEWDILSASSIRDLSNESADYHQSMIHSFVVLSTPLWATRRCASVPSNLNYEIGLLSVPNRVTPAESTDSLTSSELEQDCDSGRTTLGDFSDSASSSSSSQYEDQEGSESSPLSELSELSSTSSSECNYCEESENRGRLLHGKPPSKKILPLPEVINAAVKTAKPGSIHKLIAILRNPHEILLLNPRTRVSYLHWFAFFCDFWPAVMSRRPIENARCQRFGVKVGLSSRKYSEGHGAERQILFPFRLRDDWRGDTSA
ncbi:hypothetical protein TcWFU_008232 [Taenia crassiceps]|uniref:Uncharacterized protein n=1 Tax=Taenia crassiceps TaxID=6207 RepID=A0ABR4Q2E6_9CEST